MVSSKCSQVESPSPLVLTAPLMPPCAQTECERFTGTTEKRSTACPPSAILIAAARPARPPPTIAILVPLLAILEESSQQSARTYKSNRGIDTDEQHENSKTNARVAGQPLRAFANGDAPINQE